MSQEKPAQPEGAAGQQQQVRLEIDDSAVAALYANFCRVATTPEEVILDLALNPDPTGGPTQKIKVTQRVILNHFTAKRLAALLAETVKRHEKVFGTLEMDVRKRVQPEMSAMVRYIGRMSHPENEDSGEPVPLHGQVRHSHLSARVPEAVGRGVFANGVMILTGAYEIVLDFVLRFGEPNRIVARVILPHVVARQLIAVLQENLQAFETRFGPVPRLPRVRPVPGEAGTPLPPAPGPEGSAEPGASSGTVPAPPPHPENLPQQPAQPQIEDIYDELRLPDGMLSGSYANAVLVRHTGTEFCFDFITNIFPRSAVSSRVYVAAPHVSLLLQSLIRSLNPGPPRG